MMNRTLLLSFVVAVVLSGSAAAAYGVFADDQVTVSSVCVPVMENDRDYAGLSDNIAVVTVEKTIKVTAYSDYHEALSRIRVDENLKGSLPPSLDVTETVDVAPDGSLVTVADYKAALQPGHRYAIAIYRGYTGTPDVWRSTAADGAALDTVRARWKDAIARQNPPRSDPKCTSDVVVVP
ncbi:hypothetical protein [Streptomyces sp. NPDC059247]|uniref:hypothetical protein n=1 Tax=Streptomyces sp. NPDC059247 TaxID=3346790 RepID=UPI00368D9CDC